MKKGSIDKPKTEIREMGTEMISFTVMCPNKKKLISVPFRYLKLRTHSMGYDPGIVDLNFGRHVNGIIRQERVKDKFSSYSEYSFKCKCGRVHKFGIGREQKR